MEIDPIPDKSRETILEVPVRKTKKMMGWERLRHGCKLWEVNLSNLDDVKEAKYKSSVLDGKVLHHQVIVKPGYFYAMAINKRNALKKFWKSNPGFKI